MTWRTGRKVGRTIYDGDDQLIGVMDTPELAQQVVDAVNGTRFDPTPQRLQQLRRARGMTQTDLGQAAGINRAVIANIEAGRRNDLRVNEARALANALHVDPTQVGGG